MKPRLRTSRGKRKDRKNFDQGLVDAGKCGRLRNRTGTYCTLDAGWGTDHVGVGACRKHGGSTPLKTGEYAEAATVRLGDAYQRFREDPKLATIDREIAILRGIMEKRMTDEGPTEDVADLVERVVRAVDILLKHQAKFGLTMETFNRVTGQMGVIVAKHVTSPEILGAIQRDWDEIRLTS